MNKLVIFAAVGVPREVLSHDWFDNCLPRLRTYLAELALGTEAENEVKVILLGNGRVGKTQLCRRFRGQSFDETVTSTHGVQIWREELRIRTGNEEQVFQVNWWDFGGQDIYHGTHALFLRSRAVFLILWTPQLENRDDYLENGIPLRNQPLAYWLDYVRTLAGENSPVIVVQSQCDRITDRRPPPARLDGPGFFEASYSAKEDLGRDTLEAHLRDAMRYLLERHGALEIGHGRAEVRRRLYDWRSKDQKRKPEKRGHRTLSVDEFRALCDKVGGIVSWEHALDYFHHTGVVFYRPDLFASRIVLDQDWALDAVYTMFHRGRAAPWLRDSGRFTREDLAWMAWQEHSSEEQRLFLGLMESCGVCFQCGWTSQGEPRYVAPDLLPGFEAVKGRLHAWKEKPGMHTLRLEYRFFHQAVIRGLMSRIGQKAGDLAEYWKYGFWFKDGRRDTQILVQFEDTSTVEAPGAGALVLKALGQGSLGLLREIRRVILRQRVGEEPEELLTLEGTTVARSALAAGFDGRVLDLQKKPVPAAAFAAFFEGREHDPGEPAGIDITPQPLADNEKPREVFISYAWRDDTAAGKIRAKVVDELCSALEKDGFVPVRDRDRIRPGDRISVFIRQLTRADYVVAVISKKYLRSPYCMYEIYKLWQRWQGDADAMARSVVPIVLPEVKVGNALKRAPHIRYWKAEGKKLEKLHRDLGLSLSPESVQEARLVQEFAHHIDAILVFLNDILMPRQLTAHLDHGFPAVREALQRRMSGE
ncbi:MAG TPA: COR domain-containing protein [Thermoanaerobaculia bacterium]|nr:COR domain-containing protein [Thermoanaerobaculia bacterium]